jgi:hypothetical protein
MINPANVNWFFSSGSGGSGNKNPLLSLGGPPSTYQVYANIGSSLFNNVTEEEAVNGYIDYRCVYLINNGLFPLYNTELFLASDTFGGADMFIGCPLADEVQVVDIIVNSQPSGTVYPSSGSVNFAFGSVQVVLYCPSSGGSAVAWANNMKSALLNSVSNPTGITSVNVVGELVNQGIRLTITFTDADGNKKQPILVNTGNNLTPASTVLVSETVAGNPINQTSVQTATITQVPTGINFLAAGVQNPITIGTVNPNDYFAVWVKRYVAPGTQGVPNDGADLVVMGSPFPNGSGTTTTTNPP